MPTSSTVMATRPHSPASIGMTGGAGGGGGGRPRTCHDHAVPSHHRRGATRHGSSYQPGGGRDGGANVMAAGGYRRGATPTPSLGRPPPISPGSAAAAGR